MPFITTSDQIRLHYRETGCGVPLILIHGLGSCVEDWTLQTAYFRKKYRIIAMDMRGHGKSQKPLPHLKSYSIPRMARDVHEVLTHLRVKKGHAVGLSMGACVGLQAALDFPQDSRSLTLVNGPIDPGGTGGLLTLHIGFRLFVVKHFGTDTLAPIIARRLFPYHHQEDLRTLALRRIGENPKWTYHGAVGAIRDMHVVHRLDELRIPTMIVIGGDDRIVPLTLKQELVHRFKDPPRVKMMPNAGHAPPLDSPDEFNKILNDWLDQTSPEAN